MMTAEENRKKIIRNNILISLFFCLMIIGVVGAVFYYRKLTVAEASLQEKNLLLQKTAKDLEKAYQELKMTKDSLAKQKERFENTVASAVKNNEPEILKSAVKTISTARDSARNYARIGYYKLKEKDFVGAKQAFDKSEKFYNGYRDSYEVSFLLSKNKDKLNDPKVQKELLEKIQKDYNSLGILSKADIK